MSDTSLAPTRKRGHLRVAAISQAAIELFAERGFDGTTMTEIASRSGTAIGSLYRFFPTKEILADSLLRSYLDTIREGMEALGRDAPALDAGDLAGRLVHIILNPGPEHAATGILADARRDGPYRREILRQFFQEGLQDILHAFAPGRNPDDIATKATVVRHYLKATRTLHEEQPGPSAATASAWISLLAKSLQELRQPDRS